MEEFEEHASIGKSSSRLEHRGMERSMSQIKMEN